MRRSLVVGIALLSIAVLFVAVPSLLTAPSTEEVAPVADREPDIVRPEGSESGFWPYLNSRRAFEQRSPINVVVRGDTATVVRSLSRAGGDWEETAADEEDADSDTHSLLDGGDRNESANATAREQANVTGNATAGERANVTGNATTGETTNATVNGSTVEDGIQLGSTRITWSRTTGATRYAYVVPGDESEGSWIVETAQLHDGTYYGHRYHIRLYETPSPDDEWVVMQTHSEHFDWFTLRHRVHGSQDAQKRLESDLMALPNVDEREDVSRIYLGNANSADADGWATFVDLLALALSPLVIGVGVMGITERAADGLERHLTESDRRRLEAARARLDARHMVLVGAIVTLVLGVRVGGIALERHSPLSMYAIAALLYPIIGLGLPIATYLIASGLERRLDAAAAAGGGLAAAIWLDYGLLGVASLPIDVIGQRMLVVVALGLIAAGAARRATRTSRWNDMLVAGSAMWVLVLVGTLLELL